MQTRYGNHSKHKPRQPGLCGDSKHLGQVKLMSQRKAKIDHNFDPNKAGEQAVLHEMIAKDHHTVLTELDKFVPTGTANDKRKAWKIQAVLRHERQNMERY